MPEELLQFMTDNAGKLLFLLIVVAAGIVITKICDRLIVHALDRSSIPSVSLFVNIARTLIWSAALTSVLQPVFGINPTTFITALGVGGVALSLGMKDTISNSISGFGLMLGKVIQPGDIIRIGGTTGIVKDINWRHTVLEERGGTVMVIPNALLNTSSFERLTKAAEATVAVDFVAKPDISPALVEAHIIDVVTAATKELCLKDFPPTVRFRGFSAYGIVGTVYLTAKFSVFPSTVADAATKALIGADFLVQDAKVG